MARIVAIVSSRADLTAPLLERYRETIAVQRTEGDLAWGVGVYQAGEVLLRRRPSDERESVSLSIASERVAAEILLGHIRRPTTGSLRTENTHPFRYQKWLFAHDGGLPAFDTYRATMLNALPDFLRRSIRGDTDSEVLFYSVLGSLHELGALGAPITPPERVVEALRETTRTLDAAIAAQGAEPDRTDMVLTDGENVHVLHRSNSMAVFESTDPRELKSLVTPERLGSQPPERLERDPFEGARVSMVVSGLGSLPEGFWRPEPGSVLTLSRNAAPVVATL